MLQLEVLILELVDNVHALDDLSEHHVLAIEPLGLSGAEEKLGTVGVGPSVGHGEDSRSGVLQLEVLILELVAIDGLASSSVSGGEVATLAHEVGDDAMEGGSLVAVALLTRAQGAEVLRGLRDDVTSQLHDDFAHGSAISGDVKEDSGGHFR